MSIVGLQGFLGVPLDVDVTDLKFDSKTLVTVSNSQGERSALITTSGIQLVDPNDYVIAPTARETNQVAGLRKFYDLATKIVGWSLVAVMVLFVGASLANVVTARVVLTNSMTPAINPGDVIFTLSTDYSKPEIGKVVVYQGKRFDDSPVAPFAHRIIGGNEKSGWEMKGDNNPAADIQKPKNEEILGVVVMRIPHLGKFLQPQVLTLFLVFIFGIWLIRDAFKSEE
jgi:signal peptidase I